ncbi:stromal interaction molecule homolog isoform X7 [Penaeus monodon]|uniref:stromal interaction molecule homolog isoform X7 n=1 Tax=Penaeus monodon TaxID=6687 RepID=UPI0018A72744|nr:stromal interaction molecule homolog isoform X7 [Penaeus monodon]
MEKIMARTLREKTVVILSCFVGLVIANKYPVSEKGCVPVDELCLVPEEVPNYEAIKSLHSQLDDDRSGDIDVSESVEFLKEELQYAKGYEKRQKVFHSNNDQYISVRELWHMWKKSEVHNWTVEQTVSWLAESVELQQYAQNFYANAVNGSVLPRLAANNEQFLTKVLGIKDPKHRSKITIKAMDVVLFGPPKETGSHVKDLVLVTLLTLALIGCFKAYQRNRQYEGQLSDMLRDMEKLREAEENLRHLEQRVQTNTKAEERQISEENREHNEEVQLLKQQLEEEREKNEQMKEQMKWSAPRDLQHWLQLTYERERLAFEKKQRGAREQFSQARDLCEKLNRQRRSLIGMIASVNGKMENIDQSISQARMIMEEVTQELREREQRWQNIEVLAGCSIITNAGLHALELMLRPQVNGRPHSTYAPSIGRSSRLSASLDDFDDDNLSLYTQASGASSCYGGVAINSSGLGGTPRDSMVDVRGSVGSVRKRSQLLTRDSGSSLGSEASITQTTVMHHSQTYTAGMGLRTEEEECIRRASSTGSITVTDCPQSKDSESSTEETDGSACVSETTSFSMGGSRLTLNSECSRTISPVQVSSTTPAHTPANAMPQTSSGGVLAKPSPKRSPMLKSFSQDTDASNTPDMRWKERENISASEPALDSPRTSLMLNKKKGASPSEEGNSSDSSMMEERPPSADSRKKSKSWFRNGISSSLKFSRSKKLKETDKDSSKNNTKHLSADFCLHASQYAI